METVECEYCGKTLPKDEATYYEAAGIYACPDCAKSELTYCSRCGEMISIDDSSPSAYGRLCESCYDDLFDCVNF